MRHAQRGVLTRRLPEAYGSAALDRPSSPSSPTPLASISAVSPVSPPTPPPLLRQPRPPGLGEELFLEEPRDAETSQWEEARRGDWHRGWEGRWEGERRSRAVNQSNVGLERVRAGAREREGPASVLPRKLGARVCKNPATCSLFPLMEILRSQ